jgi:hypothetical protein
MAFKLFYKYLTLSPSFSDIFGMKAVRKALKTNADPGGILRGITKKA